jgi:hypothetical protein
LALNSLLGKAAGSMQSQMVGGFMLGLATILILFGIIYWVLLFKVR